MKEILNNDFKQINIIVASNNEGKIREIKEILNTYNILSLKDAKLEIDIEENGKTFLENSILKSEAIATTLNGEYWCIADDSGIEVEYLNGFPGVYSKRWFEGTDRERNLALIEKLKDIPKEKRKVSFNVAMSISNGIKTYSSIGTLEGYIANEPRGENGFGFDEIFELENGKTLAEITLKEKNKISARKIAIIELKEKFENK